MKKHPFRALAPILLSLLVAAPFSRAAATGGASNPYDLLGRVLTPLAGVFCQAGSRTDATRSRAVGATLVLEALTGAPPEWTGARVEIVVQPPDRLLIRVPLAGGTVTLCRNGDVVWIAPKSGVELLTGSGNGRVRPHREQGLPSEAWLAPYVLPIPPTQMALLPVFFTVKNAGEADGLRFLDARLMPELAKRSGLRAWSARLAVKPAGADGKPGLAGIAIARPGWHAAARFERLEFLPEQPDSTWEPPADSGRFEGPGAERWLEELAGRFTPVTARAGSGE